MDGRRGRALGFERVALGALSKDGGGAERLDSGAFPAFSGLRFDLRDHGGSELLPLFLREVLPVGEGSELEGFAGSRTDRCVPEEVPPESLRVAGDAVPEEVGGGVPPESLSVAELCSATAAPKWIGSDRIGDRIAR